MPLFVFMGLLYEALAGASLDTFCLCYDTILPGCMHLYAVLTSFLF